MLQEANISGQDWFKYLKILGKISSSNRSDSLLKNIRLSFLDDAVEVMAANDRVTASCLLPATVTKGDNLNSKAIFFVDGDTFASFFKTHQSDVKISVMEDNSIVFEYKRGKFSCTWDNVLSYPSIKAPSLGDAISMESDVFVPELKRSFLFTEEHEFRPEMGCVYLLKEGDVLKFMSANMMTMFYRECEVEDDVRDLDLLVSKQAADVLYLFTDEFGSGKLYLTSDDIRNFIIMKNIVISDMKLNRKFPNFRYVLDKVKESTVLEIDRKELASAIDAVGYVENETKTVTVGFHDGILEIESADESMRKRIKEEVRVKTIYGEPFKFLVNQVHIKNSVKAVGTKTIRFNWSEAGRAFYLGDKEEGTELIFCSTLYN